MFFGLEEDEREMVRVDCRLISMFFIVIVSLCYVIF